ncbi:MAG: response regulator, partial [Bacteroidota bacterium]
AQSGKLRLGQAIIDELLGGNDIFIDTIDQPVGEIESFFKSNKEKIEQISNNLKKLMSGEKPASQTESQPKPAPEPKPAPPKKEEPPQKNEPKQESGGADMFMLELFHTEVENHARTLEEGLVRVEDDQSASAIEPLMRAAHSIKGAARIVGLDDAVTLAHAMEDVLTAAQSGKLRLGQDDIDLLLDCNDIFIKIIDISPGEIEGYLKSQKGDIENLAGELRKVLSGEPRAVKPVEAPPEEEITLEKFREILAKNSSLLEVGLIESEGAQSEESLRELAGLCAEIRELSGKFDFRTLGEMLGGMEKALNAAARGEIALAAAEINLLLRSNDVLASIAQMEASEIEDIIISESGIIEEFTGELREIPQKRPPRKLESAELRDPAEASDEELADFRDQVADSALVLERGIATEEGISAEFAPMMRAAWSIRDAARNVGFTSITRLAAAMQSMFGAAFHGRIELSGEQIEWLRRGAGALREMISAGAMELLDIYINKTDAIDDLVRLISDFLGEEMLLPPAPKTEKPKELPAQPAKKDSPPKPAAPEPQAPRQDDSFVRVLSQNLNKLMGLSGETLVKVKSIKPFSTNLLEIKNLLFEFNSLHENIVQNLEDNPALPESWRLKLGESSEKLGDIRQLLLGHIDDFEMFSRRLENVAEQLYSEAVATRMKPFAEGLHGFNRMVRDVAKKLGKRVNLRIEGESTRVDRDILEKLEAPLNHLLRNAVDHGIETIEDRERKGKPAAGTLTLSARHRSGMLIISLKDDGRGIDPAKLRRKVVEKGYVSEEMAAKLSTPELMDFLFLPGFSTAEKVTEISGRGVGLDVVFSMVSEVGGTVRADSAPDEGTTFLLELPLTLSILRTLQVGIAGESYALPLSRIDRIFDIKEDNLKTIEDRQYCVFDGENMGIVDARKVLRLGEREEFSEKIHLVIISDRLNRYGVVVDQFLGEKDLVVIPLDKKLGKIPNISSGAIMEDGSIVLILDIDDMVRSVDDLLNREKLNIKERGRAKIAQLRKRILVTDDSLTVREVERKLLENAGYDVTLAVDGADGWNKLSAGEFDLVISDVDMPRMNGIEFVSKIRSEVRYRDLPVMIVSYKDREEDKLRGLDAGANYYLTKSSFHDETLLEAVRDLIGDARE